MNILPKKSWHVRTKRNIERVRRDEEKAAEEEKEKQRRIALAEQEARTDLLRVRARKRHHDELEEEPSSPTQATERSLTKVKKDISLDQGGHINFFKDIEEGLRCEGKNKDHEREKAAEKEKWEKNIGLLTFLGQSSIESQNEQPWYLKNSKKDQEKEVAENEKRDREVKRQQAMDPLGEMRRHLERTHKHKDIHREKQGHQIKRETSKSSKTITGKPAVSTGRTMEQLRAERMKRELEEQRRTGDLMARMRGEKTTEREDAFVTDADRDRARRYNSQFNPDFVKPISRPRR